MNADTDKRGPGAPTISNDGTRTVVRSVSLTPAQDAFFKALGGGSLTKGLREAYERLQGASSADQTP